MTVNANSVIPTKLNSYSPSAYSAVTDMENYCYTQSTKGTESDYKPFFQDLADAMSSWFNVDRTDATRNLLEKLYIYILFNNNYGTSDNLLGSAHTLSLYNMGGYLSMIVDQPITYYDDFVPATSGSMPVPASAANLQNDTSSISGASSGELSNANSMASSMETVTTGMTFQLMYDHVPLINPALSQEQIGSQVFDDMNWLLAFNQLNINLPIPSYI